jgi:hypothetical protein
MCARAVGGGRGFERLVEHGFLHNDEVLVTTCFSRRREKCMNRPWEHEASARVSLTRRVRQRRRWWGSTRGSGGWRYGPWRGCTSPR